MKRLVTPVRLWIVALMVLVLSQGVLANNLSIQNVEIAEKNTTDNYVIIQFDISWENSWRDLVNYDGAWVFIKYKKTGLGWKHATLHATGHTAPSGCTLEVGSTDGVGKGVFLYRSSSGNGDISWSGVQVRWDYGADGLNDNDLVTLKVFGIEMVYVPQGSFYVGIHPSGSANNEFFTYGTSNDPYLIDSEDAIDVGTTDGYLYYIDNTGNAGDQSGPIPAAYPKGYDAFWCMKYELTQGQYVDFLNTLTRDQQNTRTATDVSTSDITNVYVMSNTSNASSRNTITCPSSGNGTTTPITFSTSSPDRACNYIAIDDLAAYLDWAALRLMTELEFEKACRGPEYPAVDECAWGNNSWTNITGFNGTDGSGTETKTPANANTHINNSSNVNGPVRVGIFAASEDGNGYTRQNAGASYWGIMELSGNVYERVISVGNNHGRGYDGTLGDGELNSSGNANASTWYPAIYDQAYRGGDYYSPIIHSIVGDRSYGSFINTARSPSGGGRGVRP